MIGQKIIVEAYKHVISLLRKVNHFPYHNIAHTLDVYRRAKELGIAENINEDDMADLLISALFHDVGFVVEYNKNEIIGARMAREWLESKGHPEVRIKKVEGIIMATVLFAKPNTLLEGIIQDADLDNLGRNDGISKTERYAVELSEQTPDFVLHNYLTFTERLYREHTYNTETAKKERTQKQLNNLEELRTKYDLS